MKNCKMSGKSQGILRWMISGNSEMDILSGGATLPSSVVPYILVGAAFKEINVF